MERENTIYEANLVTKNTYLEVEAGKELTHYPSKSRSMTKETSRNIGILRKIDKYLSIFIAKQLYGILVRVTFLGIGVQFGITMKQPSIKTLQILKNIQLVTKVIKSYG